MTVKRLVDKLFKHYFQNIRRVDFWGLCHRPPSGLCLWTPLRDGSPRPPNLQHSWKKPWGRPYSPLLIVCINQSTQLFLIISLTTRLMMVGVDDSSLQVDHWCGVRFGSLFAPFCIHLRMALLRRQHHKHRLE